MVYLTYDKKDNALKLLLTAKKLFPDNNYIGQLILNVTLKQK